MKYVFLFLISFNVYAACDESTVDTINACTARDNIGEYVAEMSLVGKGNFSPNGATLAERFDNSDAEFKRLAREVMRKKRIKMGMKKINCSLHATDVAKRQCRVIKGQ